MIVATACHRDAQELVCWQVRPGRAGRTVNGPAAQLFVPVTGQPLPREALLQPDEAHKAWRKEEQARRYRNCPDLEAGKVGDV